MEFIFCARVRWVELQKEAVFERILLCRTYDLKQGRAHRDSLTSDVICDREGNYEVIRLSIYLFTYLKVFKVRDQWRILVLDQVLKFNQTESDCEQDEHDRADRAGPGLDFAFALKGESLYTLVELVEPLDQRCEADLLHNF